MSRDCKPSSAPSALARPLAGLLISLMLAACTPFQRGTPGGTPGGAPGDAASRGTQKPGTTALLAAEARIGAPYRYGGSGPDAFDCSGLVSYAYASAGISLPRTAAAQFAAVTPVQRGDLEPGDLVFFRVSGRDVSHVGIYAGNDEFVDAPQTGGTVRLARLDDEWYRQRYVGAGRPY